MNPGPPPLSRKGETGMIEKGTFEKRAVATGSAGPSAPAGGVGDWCKKGAAELGIEITPGQGRLFDQYYRLILKKNSAFNLTSILEEKEFALKNIVDSLTCLLAVSLNGARRVVDVGAGAGLPGIPVKIARPEIRLTLVDSSLKKAAFLEDAIRELGLTETKVLRGRAEELAHRADLREQFDCALSRALAPLPVLLEYCLGFVRPWGFLIALKGPAAVREEAESARALFLLGGVIRETKEIALPFLGHRRRLIVVEKTAPTPPKYPRRTGIPAKRPLIGG
ncbi:MAG: 16S rRNA (guanine(527)-N(7))-methyltransferase RsmG [Armatimonadetes bacterium]|nr:16S rRNA (guanine(527)-N(7))-methyltransferase RsmG [Armatimonadota bacterium]